MRSTKVKLVLTNEYSFWVNSLSLRVNILSDAVNETEPSIQKVLKYLIHGRPTQLLTAMDCYIKKKQKRAVV